MANATEPAAAPAAAGGRQAALTVGMAVYDDYDGAYFTALALRLFHPEVADRVDILLLDNNPHGPAAPALRDLQDTIPHLRYLPISHIRGTAVRDLVFREARTEWVLCVDCHVLLAPGSLARFLEYADAHPRSRDLLQGPLLYNDIHTVRTHMDPVWNGLFGVWGSDPRGQDPDSPPFEITMHGLGLFGCRKDAWLGFNPRMRGHGGEEGYIHKKYRAAGHRALCLPFLRWTHRFDRPAGQPYPAPAKDRIRNYLMGWDETGTSTEDALAYFRETCSAHLVNTCAQDWAAEKASPFFLFDDIVAVLPRGPEPDISRLEERFTEFRIRARVRRLRAPALPDTPQSARTLAHRRAIEQARQRSLANVLVMDHNTVLPSDTSQRLTAALPDLRQRPWAACLIGATPQPARRPPQHTADEPSPYNPAIAYHARIFDHLLTELPTTEEEARTWTQRHTSIQAYLARTFPDELLDLTQHRRTPHDAAEAARGSA